MKTLVSPHVLAIVCFSLLSPLAMANTSQSSKASSKGSAASFHLPAPASSKVDRSTLRAQTVQQKVNSKQLKAYNIDPNSLSNGLIALSKAYRNLPNR